MSENPQHLDQQPVSVRTDVFNGSPQAVGHDIDGHPIFPSTKPAWEIAGEAAGIAGEAIAYVLYDRLIPHVQNEYERRFGRAQQGEIGEQHKKIVSETFNGFDK